MLAVQKDVQAIPAVQTGIQAIRQDMQVIPVIQKDTQAIPAVQTGIKAIEKGMKAIPVIQTVTQAMQEETDRAIQGMCVPDGS